MNRIQGDFGGRHGEPWFTLWRTRRSALVNYAVSLTRCPSAAEDLLHDVLVHLVSRGARADDPLAYAIRCLRNETARRARTGTMRDPHPPVADPGLRDDPGLAAALDRLSEMQREVILLRTRSGMTYDQMAIALDMPAATVASHYARGLKQLRALLRPNEESEHERTAATS